MPITMRSHGWVVGTWVLLATACAPAPRPMARSGPGGAADAEKAAFVQPVRKTHFKHVLHGCKPVEMLHQRTSQWQDIEPGGGFVFILPKNQNEPLYVLWVDGGQPATQFKLTEVAGDVAGVEVRARDADGAEYHGYINAWLLVDWRKCHPGQDQIDLGVVRVSDADHDSIEASLGTMVLDRKRMVVQSKVDHLSTYLMGTN